MWASRGWVLVPSLAAAVAAIPVACVTLLKGMPQRAVVRRGGGGVSAQGIGNEARWAQVARHHVVAFPEELDAVLTEMQAAPEVHGAAQRTRLHCIVGLRRHDGCGAAPCPAGGGGRPPRRPAVVIMSGVRRPQRVALAPQSAGRVARKVRRRASTGRFRFELTSEQRLDRAPWVPTCPSKKYPQRMVFVLGGRRSMHLRSER